MAWWFKHMLKLKLTSRARIARAMSDAHPFTALDRLYVETVNGLAARLERIVALHAPVQAAHHPQINILVVPQEDEPLLSVSVDGFYRFDLPSLHAQPHRRASLVHEALDLVSRTLILCMVPRDTWDGAYNWVIEMAREEFEELRAAGLLHNIEAACAYLNRQGANYFSTDPDILCGQLAHCRALFDSMPPWLRQVRSTNLIARNRRLMRIARQYEIESGPHPWLTFVRYATQCIGERFRSDAALTAARRAFTRYEQDSGSDAPYPLATGLWVTSQTDTELKNMEEVLDGMANACETAMVCFGLASIPSARLNTILETMATGLGLLLRAEATDIEVRRNRQ